MTDTIEKILVGDYYGCDMTPVTVSKEKWQDAHESVTYFEHKLNQAMRDVEKYQSYLKTAKYQEELQSLAIYPKRLDAIAAKYERTIVVEDW